MRTRPISLHRQQGFSYVEVLVATVLIAVSLVPAMEALQMGVQGAEIHKRYVVDHYQVVGKFEQVLAQSFSGLLVAAASAGSATTASGYSDPGGTANRRIVYLSFYDAGDSDGDKNPFTIADANSDGDNNPYTGSDVDISLLWVRAEIEGTSHAMETLVSR